MNETSVIPEMYQVAENLLPVKHSTPWRRLTFPVNALLYWHQEDAVTQEGHMIDGHIAKVIGHQEHLHHSFVGIE